MDGDQERELVHRELETARQDPSVQIAEIVADLEERNAAELAMTHGCIDDVLANIFSNPPSPEAQLQVTFSYEGYRITVEQNGHAKFVKLE